MKYEGYEEEQKAVVPISFDDENTVIKKNPANLKIAIGFVLAFGPLVNIIGIILIFMGLKEIKKTGEGGKVLGIIGLIIALAPYVFLIGLLILLWGLSVAYENDVCKYGSGYSADLDNGYIMCEELTPESNKYICEVIDNGKVEETTCWID